MRCLLSGFLGLLLVCEQALADQRVIIIGDQRDAPAKYAYEPAVDDAVGADYS